MDTDKSSVGESRHGREPFWHPEWLVHAHGITANGGMSLTEKWMFDYLLDYRKKQGHRADKRSYCTWCYQQAERNKTYLRVASVPLTH